MALYETYGRKCCFVGGVKMVYHRSAERSSSSKPRPVNAFANDGSFMEMFKKLQEQQASANQTTAGSSRTDGNEHPDQAGSGSVPAEGTSVTDKASSSESKPTTASKPGFVGKRRGGRVLATGKVKKIKPEGHEDEEAPPKDAWSLYLAEVKKYKQTTCEEEGKTRPLVK